MPIIGILGYGGMAQRLIAGHKRTWAVLSKWLFSSFHTDLQNLPK